MRMFDLAALMSQELINLTHRQKLYPACVIHFSCIACRPLCINTQQGMEFLNFNICS